MYSRLFLIPIIILMMSTTACKEKITYVKVETNDGEMILKLYNETPNHRDNFIKLVEEGYYDGLLFHRVMNSFMIQGGDPDSKTARPGQRLGSGGPDYKLDAEMKEEFFHKKGALAAARQPDQVNPERRSSGSQFYIVHGKKLTDSELDLWEQRLGTEFVANQREAYKTIGGTPQLDNKYTVFGEVVSGFDVIDKIAAIPVDRVHRPIEDVAMKLSIVKWKE